MKRLTNWRWMVCLGGVLCAMAAVPAVGQNVDLTIDSVNVVYTRGDFQVTPYIGLANMGTHDGHLLKLAVEYGTMGYRLVSDVVQYAIDHHTCWNYQPGFCGEGECLDLYTFTADWEGNCVQWPNYYLNCGCKYTIVPFVEPIQYELTYTTMTVTVDPFNEVPETNEDNNTVVIDLGPIPNEIKHWSAIKSMFR